MKYFKTYSRKEVLGMTHSRKFETKIGERIACADNAATIAATIQNSPAPFVLFGIPEDIGVRANGGVGGAHTVWEPFLSAFLNTQSNDFLDGNEILLAGYFDFSELEKLIDQNAISREETIAAFRHAVITIDQEVEHLVKLITENKKIPIAIGGGHNNSYPMIKGTAKGLYKAGVLEIAQLNCINLDAHTDYRPLEGRHSGNGFRYAEEDGFLQKYCVIGIHENYIPQNVWIDFVNNPFADCITYEDIFIHEKRSFMQAVAHALSFTEDNHCGIELDLDCIEQVLSSAATPSGLSTHHARQYITLTASACKAAYLHICEGATVLNDGSTDKSTGKLVSYLVSDFIKSIEEEA